MDVGERAHGRISILIKERINAEQVILNSNLQPVAIKIKYSYKKTICNIYLPDIHWAPEDLQESPLVGDFNFKEAEL